MEMKEGSSINEATIRETVQPDVSASLDAEGRGN